jgi:hypothetical protein
MQLIESDIRSASQDVPVTKWFHFVMDIFWVLVLGVFIGEIAGTLTGMYWLNTAPKEEHTQALYDAVKSAMPKGMFAGTVTALLIYFGFRIAALFKVTKIKTSNDVFKAKFFMLRNENRWIALENLIRSFVGEKIAERNDFESSDLVKVSYQLWDKVRLCNSKMLMLPVFAVLTLVTFPLFSCVLHYTSHNITPIVETFITQQADSDHARLANATRLVVNITMFLVDILFIVLCAVIANKAISNIELANVFNSEKRFNDFFGMLFWFALIVISWHIRFFPFLPEAFIVTFLLYATGIFYDESIGYDAATMQNVSEKKIYWFVMPIVVCLAGLFFLPNSWMSIAVVGAMLFIAAFLLTKRRGIHPMISIGRKVFVVALTCFLLRNYAPYFLTGSYIPLDINALLMLAACFSVIGIFAVKYRQNNNNIVVFDLSDYLSKILLLIRYKNQLELWVEQGMRGKDFAIVKQSPRNTLPQSKPRSMPVQPEQPITKQISTPRPQNPNPKQIQSPPQSPKPVSPKPSPNPIQTTTTTTTKPTQTPAIQKVPVPPVTQKMPAPPLQKVPVPPIQQPKK